MSKIYVVSYKTPLDSVTELKRLLGRKLVRVAMDSKTHKFDKNNRYLNWGCGRYPVWVDTNPRMWLNHPQHVTIASNKLKTFLKLDLGDISTVEFTEEQEKAQQWVNEGNMVVGRSLLKGSGGRGILLFETPGEAIKKCPLYTKYKKKRHEYRVHVFNGNVIDVQWKRRVSEPEGGEVDTRIRNHDRGWVFCREGITEPKGMRELAIAAVSKIGLYFGAVDIIWNERDNKCYVLEINTAPGITGTTAQNYANALEQLLK